MSNNAYAVSITAAAYREQG